MITVELTSDQIGLLLQSLCASEIALRAKRPPNSYQRSIVRDRIREVLALQLALTEARDVSEKEAAQ